MKYDKYILKKADFDSLESICLSKPKVSGWYWMYWNRYVEDLWCATADLEDFSLHNGKSIEVEI